MATACQENQDLESIILFDDTDADIKDDEEPPAVQQRLLLLIHKKSSQFLNGFRAV